jgi:hypothetical protein
LTTYGACTATVARGCIEASAITILPSFDNSISTHEEARLAVSATLHRVRRIADLSRLDHAVAAHRLACRGVGAGWIVTVGQAVLIFVADGVAVLRRRGSAVRTEGDQGDVA